MKAKKLLQPGNTVVVDPAEPYLNASRHSEHLPQSEGKLSKRLVGGIIGCKYKSSYGIQTGSLMVVTLGQKCNVGEKPTVILYTYINRHAEPSSMI